MYTLDPGDPINSGLVHAFACSEGSGRRLNDLCQTGDALWNATSSSWRGSPVGTGLLGNGVNYAVGQRPTNGQLPISTAQRTIWVSATPDSVTGWAWVFAYGHWNANQTWKIGRNGSSLVGSTMFTNLTSASFWSIGTHCTAALSYDGATWRLYGNGALLNSGAVTPDTQRLNTFIGCSTNGTEYWSGPITGVRLWSRCLTHAEIARLGRERSVGLVSDSFSVKPAWTRHVSVGIPKKGAKTITSIRVPQ